MPAGPDRHIPAGVQDHRQGPLRIHAGRAGAGRAVALSLLPARPAGRAGAGDTAGDGRHDGAYDQTLRKGFDDATCGELTRATLAAYLPSDEDARQPDLRQDRAALLEDLLPAAFLGGDKAKAEAMGVKITAADWATFVACGAFIGVRKTLYGIACRLPGVRRSQIACWCGSWSACWRAMGMLRIRRMRRRTGLLW